MSTAVFCDQCVPAGGVEEYTICFLNPPRCDRCGCAIESGHYHVGSVERIWSLPIAVSERQLPEHDCLVYNELYGWRRAFWLDGRLQIAKLHTQVARADITHWLPTPPEAKRQE